MKKPMFLMSVIGILPAMLTANVSFAQTAVSASDLLAAVNSLQAVDAARQNIQYQVNWQLAQVMDETRNLSQEPINTSDEQEALVAELGAITAKLDELSNAATALNQIQATENSIFASLQVEQQALGVR